MAGRSYSYSHGISSNKTTNYNVRQPKAPARPVPCPHLGRIAQIANSQDCPMMHLTRSLVENYLQRPPTALSPLAILIQHNTIHIEVRCSMLLPVYGRSFTEPLRYC